jgi:hypothetical protein
MAHELEEDFPEGGSARLVLKGVRPCQGVCRGPFLENSPATKDCEHKQNIVEIHLNGG